MHRLFSSIASRPPRLPACLSLLLVPGLTGVIASGCLEIPDFPRAADVGPRDAPPSARLAVTSVLVESADGRRWPSDAIPRLPRLAVLFSDRPDADAPILLLAGAPDDELAEDLGAAPLRASTLARVLDVERTGRGERVELTPREPLPAGAALTLVVAAWARSGARTLGVPRLEPLVVSTDPALGAEATDAWPPDGASGIGPSVPLLGVRFDGLTELGPEALALHDVTSGTLVPAAIGGVSCGDIGWVGPSCAALRPLRPLAPGAIHELRLGVVRDATGAQLAAFVARFKTGLEPDLEPPLAPPFECALDETPIEIGCAFSDDRSVRVRVRGVEPLRAVLETERGRVGAVFSRGEGELGLEDLAPDTSLDAHLSLTDTSGLVTRVPLVLVTSPPLPELSIVEVRADPLGREPTQEYVELENRGSAAIDLSGLRLADALDDEGDALPSLVVPPGGRVLVVAADFDPDDVADGPVPPGVPLVRIEGSLGSAGLAAYGEPLFLRDAAGQRLSAAPALPARPGVCIVRVVEDGRTGAVGAFGYDPAETCSPGTE